MSLLNFARLFGHRPLSNCGNCSVLRRASSASFQFIHCVLSIKVKHSSRILNLSKYFSHFYNSYFLLWVTISSTSNHISKNYCPEGISAKQQTILPRKNRIQKQYKSEYFPWKDEFMLQKIFFMIYN